VHQRDLASNWFIGTSILLNPILYGRRLSSEESLCWSNRYLGDEFTALRIREPVKSPTDSENGTLTCSGVDGHAMSRTGCNWCGASRRILQSDVPIAGAEARNRSRRLHGI